MKLNTLFVAVIALAQNIVAMDIPNRTDNDKIHQTTDDIVIKEDLLENYQTNTPCFRKREEGDYIVGLIYHYTADCDYTFSLSAYCTQGVGPHFTINQYGEIFLNVKPEKHIAHHAGISRFGIYEALNRQFLGVEMVNPGWVYKQEYEQNKDKYKGFGEPLEIEGDNGRLWFPFPEAQFIAACQLFSKMQMTYKLKRSLILTHADISIGRKSDAGPMFPYERAFREYGVGYYPANTWIVDLLGFDNLSDNDYLNLIHLYGYKASDRYKASKDQIIRAFQMHFSNSNISGELLPKTKISILNLVVDYYFYSDPNYGYDEAFRKGLNDFIQNKATRLGEFINGKKMHETN